MDRQHLRQHVRFLADSARRLPRLKHDGRIHNRYLTTEEFRRLREAAALQRTARVGIPCAHGFDDLPEYLDLAISLATRPTETLTLKFADVDWLNKQLAVRKTKNGKDRVLPLSDIALAALRRRLGKRHPKSDYVFHKSNGLGWKNIRDTFNQAAHTAGLWHEDPMRRVTPHTLRHTTLS